jgi:GDPmannose 4,6-dehydratase/GDP-4-dehydro-6-deoxy-D-mannose reductase|tara:strand:+ start:9095 stop:10054 length:960 start_codon:yes stop_codon:yes gene_type:complete
MNNVLITGITGSGGSYLAEYILENHTNYNVWGICRWHSTGTLNNIQKISHKISVRECDLMDFSSIIRALKECKPKRIFHLAAYANVRKCFDTPLSVINNNIMGTANLLEAIRMVCPETIVQICSTSEVYGNPVETPMTEQHPIQPVNPYSVSKLAQEALAYSYHKSWGLNTIITRMFAYINPKRRDLFATSFASQVVEIENGKRDVLIHGNLKSVRTLIDVRDAMKSYWLACDHCTPGEAYNIGGKNTIAVGEFLEILKSKSKIHIHSEEDSDLLRPVDITLQIPDISKFTKVTGWTPSISLDDSISFLLDSCRQQNFT